MIRDYLCVVNHPNESEPDNPWTNRFVFGSVDAARTKVADMEMAASLASSFFIVPVVPGGLQVGTFLSPEVSRALDSSLVDVYDITGKLAPTGLTNKGNPQMPPLGSPELTFAYTLPPPSAADALPSQLGLRITLRADQWELVPVEAPDGTDLGNKLDRPRRRYSGGLIIGPLGDNLRDGSGALPDPGILTTLRNAADNLRDLANANNMVWGIWSRSDGTIRTIVRAETVDRFATMRRRRNDAGITRTGTQLWP